MNIICSICSDQLEQLNQIAYTQCGHVFHMHCLVQWYKRSKTCPQCREEISQCKKQRLFFTFGDNEASGSESGPLPLRIDSLKFQLALRDKTISTLSGTNVTLTKVNASMKKEFKNAEREITKQKSAIYALRDQIAYFKEKAAKCTTLKNEIRGLHVKLEELKPAEVLLKGTPDDVDELIDQTSNRETLISYISVMKQEIVAILDRCDNLKITIRTLQESNAKLLDDRNSVRKERSKRLQLEEELAISESKNMALERRISELEDMFGIEKSNENSTKSSARRERSECCIGSASNKNKRKASHYDDGTKIARMEEELSTSNIKENSNASGSCSDDSTIDLDESRISQQQNLVAIQKGTQKRKKNGHNSSVVDLT